MKKAKLDIDVLTELCIDKPKRFKRNREENTFEKKCVRCGCWKDLNTEYHKRSDTRDGFAYTCKSCAKLVAKEAYDRKVGKQE